MKRKNTKFTLAPIVAALATAAPLAPVQAQDGSLEEVVVTAQRREENLQDVPISINAFSDQQIEKQRIQAFGDLAFRIPGFSVSTLNKSRLNPSLRGGSSSLAAAGAEGAVGLYIDDMYFGSVGDFEVDLFDVERIEVLRGPQGTLFGRNTTGGSINVVTKRPSDEPEATLEATYGNYNFLQFRGMISGPLTDSLSGLLAFSNSDRDGFSFNRTTGNDIDNLNRSSVRGKLLWEVADDLEVTFAAGFSRVDETDAARDSIFPASPPITHSEMVAMGFEPDDDERVTNQFTDGRYVSEQFTGSLRVLKGFEKGDLLSITSYRHLDTEQAKNSITGAPVEVFAIAEPRVLDSFSQEFRFTSDFDGPLNFVGGLYFYWADETRDISGTSFWDRNTIGGVFQAATFCPEQTAEDFANFVITPACLAGGTFTAGNQTRTYESLYQRNRWHVDENVETTSYAVFAEAKYDVLENVTLTAGGRWTYDDKSMKGRFYGDPDFFWVQIPGREIADDENWDEFTYRFGVDWHVTDSIMLYGTASRGFRSGAYEITQTDPSLSSRPVGPEFVDSYEGGFKSRFWDDRLQLNVTYFDATYDDLQFFVTTVGTLSTNAGEANVHGVEVDMVAAITDDLTLSFQYSHQDGDSSGIPVEAEIPEGTPPAGTVPNTYIVALNYDTTLANGAGLYAGLDFMHKDRYGLEFNDTPQFKSEVDALVNGYLGYVFPGGKWEVSAWVKNLTNEDIVIYGQDFWFAFYDVNALAANPDIAVVTSQPRYAPPRTYGVTLKYSFF